MKMIALVGRVTSTNCRLAKAIYLSRGRGGGEQLLPCIGYKVMCHCSGYGLEVRNSVDL